MERGEDTSLSVDKVFSTIEYFNIFDILIFR